MRTPSRLLLLFLAVISIGLGASLVHAQVGNAGPGEKSVETYRTEIEADESLSVAEKSRLEEYLDKIAKATHQASEDTKAEERFYDDRKLLEGQDSSNVAQSFRPIPRSATYSNATDLRVLEGREADLQSLKTKVDTEILNATNFTTDTNKRIPEIEREIERLKSQRDSISQEEDLVEQPGDSPLLRELKSRLRREKVSSYGVAITKLIAERQFLNTKLEREQKELDALEDLREEIVTEAQSFQAILENAEERKTQLARANVERNLRGLHAELQPLVETAIEYRDEAIELAQLKNKVRVENQRLEKTAEELKSNRALLEDRLESVGRSEFIGIMLRQERRSLPYLPNYKANAEKRRESLQKAQIRQIELEEETSKKKDLRASFDSSQTIPSNELDKAVSSYSSALEDLKTSYRAYIDLLSESENLGEGLLREREAYRSFLEEHILWIRSAPLLKFSDLGKSLDALTWASSPETWKNIEVGNLLKRHPIRSILFVIGLVVLVAFLKPLKTQQERITNIVEKASAAPWSMTFRAWLILIARALPGPLVLGILGWEASLVSDQELGPPLSNALLSAAFVLFLIAFEIRLCRKGGVGEIHFDWNVDSMALFRRHLYWLAWVLVPCVFVVRFLTKQEVSLEHTNSLGRLVFIVQNLTLAVFAHITLRPSSPVIHQLSEKYLGKLVERLGLLWYLLVVGLPLGLAAMAISGYFYTASAFSVALLRSVIALLIIMQLNALVSRYVFLATRRMAVRRAKTRRRAAGLDQLSEEEIENDKLTAQDIKSLRNDSRSLRRIVFSITFAAVLYMIWSSLLPAFRFFDDVEIYDYMSSDGSPAKVVLGDLFGAIIMIAATTVAVKTLPNLLEATILRRFGVDRGGRYAAKAILRYVLIVFGSLMAFNRLGVAWGDVQWLAAGLSVGLGFGLQEIFANFISGLIMLFERPVRVGDTVTVNNISGTVTRINMRATTVLDWERKELIVPNKMFVTDSLINWSLSDDVVRLTAEVGVAYGSDLGEVERILLDIAKNEPLVVSEPKPMVIFREFGDSTLNFELRVFTRGVEDWLLVKDAVNTRIDKRFREAGIEIAFPQRVVHFANPLATKSAENTKPQDAPESGKDEPQ